MGHANLLILIKHRSDYKGLLARLAVQNKSETYEGILIKIFRKNVDNGTKNKSLVFGEKSLVTSKVWGQVALIIKQPPSYI